MTGMFLLLKKSAQKKAEKGAVLRSAPEDRL
jgi:hypothetical protein